MLNAIASALTECESNRLHEFVFTDRLVEKRESAGAMSARLERAIATSRDDDGGGPNFLPAKRLEKFEPVHFRHMEIKQQAPGVPGGRVAEKFPRGGILADNKPVRLQQDPHRIPHCSIIVDNAYKLTLQLLHHRLQSGLFRQRAR